MAARRKKSNVVTLEDGFQYAWKPPRFYLHFPGFKCFSSDMTTVDGEYVLVDCEPEPMLGLSPKLGTPAPTLAFASFVAHCLAYEHDVAISIVQASGMRRAFSQPIAGRARTADEYFELIEQMTDLARDLRYGSLVGVRFRRPDGENRFDLPLTARYGAFAPAIEMYSTALRQFDPLSELLQYYRVIEFADAHPTGASRANGKAWVRAALGRLAGHKFGRLFVGRSQKRGDRMRRDVIEVLSIFRRKALARLKALQARPTPVDRYLYNEMRCGIAHGTSGQKVFDFDVDLEDAARDVHVVKMLARLAIDEMIPPGARRTGADDGSGKD